MYPNAALGLACGGAAILGMGRGGWQRWVATLGGVGVTLIGLVGLYLHLTGAGRTWYEALFPSNFVAATTPVGGRPAPETCVAFVLLGSGLIAMLLRRAPIVAQALALSAATVGGTAVVGYLLGVDRRALGTTVIYVGMALHTAIGITVLGLAAILVRPFTGLLRQLLDGGIAATMTRRP
jgi:hypothetical protein